MGFFINEAWAAKDAAGGPGGSLLSNPILLMVGFFVIFYFILIRPQQKKQKEHRAMVATLAKGDEVITTGGLLGRVTKVNDNYLILEVADGTEMTFQRQAVQTVLPKGTIKSI